MQEQPSKAKWCKTAIVGFVLALIGAVFIFILIADADIQDCVSQMMDCSWVNAVYVFAEAIVAIVAFVISFIARRKIKRDSIFKGRGFAKVGMILSIATLFLSFLSWAGAFATTRGPFPAACMMPSGIGCVDWKATPTTYTFALRNNLGSDLKYFAVNITGDAYEGCPRAEDWVITNNQMAFEATEFVSDNTIQIESAEGTSQNSQALLTLSCTRSSGEWSGSTVTYLRYIVWIKDGEMLSHGGEGKLTLKVEK